MRSREARSPGPARRSIARRAAPKAVRRRSRRWRSATTTIAASGVRGSAMGSVTPISDKDRIFTNLYGYQEPWLKAARARGDWDDTAKLMSQGQDAIIEVVKESG